MWLSSANAAGRGEWPRTILSQQPKTCEGAKGRRSRGRNTSRSQWGHSCFPPGRGSSGLKPCYPGTPQAGETAMEKPLSQAWSFCGAPPSVYRLSITANCAGPGTPKSKCSVTIKQLRLTCWFTLRAEASGCYEIQQRGSFILSHLRSQLCQH